MGVPNPLKKIIDIASAITQGDLEKVDRTCPYCGRLSLVYSFTVNTPPRFGLFIECEHCQRRHHFSLGSKPPNFSQDLVLRKYQLLEDEASTLAAKAIQKKGIKKGKSRINS